MTENEKRLSERIAQLENSVSAFNLLIPALINCALKINPDLRQPISDAFEEAALFLELAAQLAPGTNIPQTLIGLEDIRAFTDLSKK